ncbi:MAG: hypothetical protein MZV70_46190 [Desulfobacterales bacterium]|nr:hypothetical protein [Desulfobacterales bacterium]
MDYVGIDIAYHSLDYFAKVLSPEYKPVRSYGRSFEMRTHWAKRPVKEFMTGQPERPTIDLPKATKEYDINHLIALQVNEATKVLDEGVAECAAEIDLAMANWRRLSFRSFRAGSEHRISGSDGKAGDNCTRNSSWKFSNRTRNRQ